MSARAELQAIVYRIALKSHVGAASMDRVAKSTDDAIGGRRPSGGIVRKDDREPEFALKSAEYFAAKSKLCRTDDAISALLSEARKTLDAWERTPIPDGQEPEFGSPQWKRWVAESPLPHIEIARKFNVSRQYVFKIRQGYDRA